MNVKFVIEVLSINEIMLRVCAEQVCYVCPYPGIGYNTARPCAVLSAFVCDGKIRFILEVWFLL